MGNIKEFINTQLTFKMWMLIACLVMHVIFSVPDAHLKCLETTAIPLLMWLTVLIIPCKVKPDKYSYGKCENFVSCMIGLNITNHIPLKSYIRE